MAFAVDQTVLQIKLTDKGRDLLSRGELTFKKFAIGDSEIDYEYNNNVSLDAFNAAIFKPVDANPDIVSFITQSVSGDTYTELPTIVNNTSLVTNTIQQKGMFNVTGATKVLFDDVGHVKQANCKIAGANVNGTTSLALNPSSSYVLASAEPEVGDYVMVRWANQIVGHTVGFDVDEAIPHLWYKIVSITSGTLAGNNLVVEVDRPIPDFNSFVTFDSGAMIYPNNNGRFISGDSIQNYYGSPFITDFVSESMLAFIENYDLPTIKVPVWNMTIVYTEDVIGTGANTLPLPMRGIDTTNSSGVTGNPSIAFGGLVQYLEKISPKVKNIGLIHYSNNSPSNNYGEGLVLTNATTPTINLPTIMWHKNSGGTIGITLTGDFASKASLPELNTEYADLVDQYGNVVGKVFLDLKVFIIENQELLQAMSYKTNRSWTLPAISAGFNASACPDSDLEVIIITP